MLTGTPAGNLSVIVGSYRPVTTDANGMFSLDSARQGTYPAALSGPGRSHGAAGAGAEGGGFQQRIGGQSVGAVNARGGALADGPQALQ